MLLSAVTKPRAASWDFIPGTDGITDQGEAKDRVSPTSAFPPGEGPSWWRLPAGWPLSPRSHHHCEGENITEVLHEVIILRLQQSPSVPKLELVHICQVQLLIKSRINWIQA